MTCGVLGLSLPLAGVSVGAQSQGAQRAILELVVNEVPHGDTVAVLRDGDVWVLVQALQDAGLTAKGFVGRRERLEGGEYVLLSSLAPAIRFEFDERALTLRLTAEPGLFARTTFRVEDARPADLVYGRAPSAFVNYGLTYQYPSKARAAFIEAALSLGPTSLTTTFSGTGVTRPIRGLTTLTIDHRRWMQRWSVGDVIVSSGPFDAGGAIAGVSVSREYDLDPYYRRYPSSTLTGTAQTPSTVDVYVNDRLVRSESLPPGPFDVTRVPFTAGLGTTRVVVRDVFGREREFGASYYLGPSLLAPGTREYRYAVGVLRSPDVTQLAAYGRWAAFAADRLGLTSWLTVGYRFERDSATLDGGPILSTRVWHLGEVEVGTSVSRQRQQRGRAAYLAYSFATRRVGVALAARVVSPDYATISAAPSGNLTSQTSAALSLPAGSRASLSLQYVRTVAAEIPLVANTLSQHASVASSWRPFGRLEINANVGGVKQGGRLQFTGSVGATILLGPRAVASIDHNRDRHSATTVIEAQQSPPVGSGVGFRFRSVHGTEDTFHGELTVRSPFGEYRLVRDTASGSSGTSLSVAGGLVIIGGRIHATRAVSTSYALVQVPDAPGVRVYADNHEVGRTGRHGSLLVPNLLAYHANRLSIADSDLPLDYDIETTSENVAPPFRGGAIARFTGKHIQTIVGRVTLNQAGVPLVPAFGAITLTVGDLSRRSPLGALGEFYFENLPAGSYSAQIQFDGPACGLTVTVPASQAALINLGTLTCDVKNLLEVNR